MSDRWDLERAGAQLRAARVDLDEARAALHHALKAELERGGLLALPRRLLGALTVADRAMDSWFDANAKANALGLRIDSQDERGLGADAGDHADQAEPE